MEGLEGEFSKVRFVSHTVLKHKIGEQITRITSSARWKDMKGTSQRYVLSHTQFDTDRM